MDGSAALDWRAPDLAFFVFLSLHGLAVVVSVLPVLPAALVGIAGLSPHPLRAVPTVVYVGLLGALTVAQWVFVSTWGWLGRAMTVETMPSIAQRYLMMLVPLFIPLAFVGVQRLIESAPRRRRWLELAGAGTISFALAALAQAGLYDRTIWPVSPGVTMNWITAPDIVYGAIGFPVVAVTAMGIAVLVLARLMCAPGRDVPASRTRSLRFGAIAAVTVSLAVFNGAVGVAGARYAWDTPHQTVTAAHARAIAALVGSRARDPGPALVSFDPAVLKRIEAATGIADPEFTWSHRLTFWTGRPVTVIGAEVAAQSWSGPGPPRYRVSLASPEADPSSTYHVGGARFEVRPPPAPR